MKLEDYSKYYIQGSDHYLIPKDEFEEMNDWREESNRLTILLEKKYEKVGTMPGEILYEEILKLKDRIDKAIDEIEYNMQYDDNIDDYWTTTNKLLKILKGENDE